jgi:hypothetical protein
MIWLTDHVSEKVESVGPSLESIAFSIEETIKSQKKSLIILDGIEYLISNNTFAPVVKFVRQIVDQVSEADVVFLIPISPPAVVLQDLKNLEREMVVIGADGRISFDEDKFKGIYTAEDLEHAFEMDDSLELGDEMPSDQQAGGEEPREKGEVLTSIAKTMDKIRAISDRLKSPDAPGAPGAPKQAASEDEQRTNIITQIKEWKTEGFMVNELESYSDKPIKDLLPRFNDMLDKIQKARLLITRLNEIKIQKTDPRYIFLRRRLTNPALLDEAEQEVYQMEDLCKDASSVK